MGNKIQLEQMIRLCELREERQRRALAEQQVKVEQARSEQLENSHAVALCEGEQLALSRCEDTVDVQVLADLQISRRWLKYDLEKANYLLQQAEAELLEQSDIASEQCATWQRLQDKRSRFTELLKESRRPAVLPETFDKNGHGQPQTPQPRTRVR